jgi:hypothetical protein
MFATLSTFRRAAPVTSNATIEIIVARLHVDFAQFIGEARRRPSVLACRRPLTVIFAAVGRRVRSELRQHQFTQWRLDKVAVWIAGRRP